ncbi:hypothetical protein P5V15_010617 [Pogonomyrmex californicus]
MDLYRNFVETFKQNASTRNFSALPEIFKNGQKSLDIVSLEHRESIVCSIFDQNNGLLCFLNYELGRWMANRHADNTFTEAFHFLQFFIEHFHTTSCFIQYIHQIKDVCQLALTIKCNNYTQKAACNAFVKLIELFKDHDLKLENTVKEFIEKFNYYNIKERRLILCIISKIIKHNENVRLLKYLDIVFRRLYSDTSQEYSPTINVPNDFHMYFDILADMLDNVEPPGAIREKLLHDSYIWIKDLSRSDRQPKDKQQKTRTVMKSAIDLLCRHMNLFQDWLYPDYKYWHDLLRCLSLETTIYGDCGRRALKRFYRIIGQMLANQNSEDIFLYFLDIFMKEFESTNIDLITLRLIVYGFSQMAAPCKVYMNQLKIRSMYSIITSYALPLCSSEQNHSMHIENICCYQESLSEMLRYMTDVTIENINVLVKLGIYTIKRFPDLIISNSSLAVSSLIKTISNIGIINKSLLQRYLDNIIYEGVAWSCSHTLALDAELQRDLNNLEETPICYKNYLPLWTELLNTKRYRVGEEQLVQKIANIMMNVCITLVGRLNIRVKQTSEDTVLSDVALTQSAMNQADFRIFTNLVDLYVDVIDTSEPSLFADIVHKFLYEVVRLSYKYPLISGFYKLIRVGMKIFTRISEEEEEEYRNAEIRQMKELLSNYLWHILDLIPTFSNELLIACLYLILDAPFAYVEDVLPRTLSAFKIAFTVGLSNLELAYTALTALETWTTMTTRKRERDEQVHKLLREIVAYLEPYLSSTESSIEISQNLTAVTARKRVKHVNVIDTEYTLRNFQRRVLLFLGSLDHDLLTSFVHERASRSTGASWDHKNLIKYKLPLLDTRLDIYFDRMLPRIIALARNSSDRRTKIAACEVLHSLVALTIGSSLFDPQNRFVALYGTICQVVLILGCDPDEVVCGLFHPLALQLMRWLSSRSMSMSPVIDSLFDGLTDDSNSALREFSGMCLAVFTDWSIRQSMKHVYRVIERINNLALHPLTSKRRAAAVAFNHLYRILREYDDVVSIYWLEIFYCFICSLNGCDDPSIMNALAHIEKVIKTERIAKLLNERNSFNRRKPLEFDDATLTYALYWLLSQCGSLDEHCRTKCMELYINVSEYIGSNAQKMTWAFIETYGINQLKTNILKGLESGMKDISVAENVTPLLKALDYYVWLIDKGLLPTEMLFPVDDTNEQTIFFCIRSFVCQFLQIMKKRSRIVTVIKSKELEQLQALQCKTLMTTLKFVRTLLNLDINVLPELLWDESFSAVTVKCIMCPRTIGFDMKNIEITDKLPHILEMLLNSMKSKYSNALPETFKKHLLNSVRKHITNLLNFNNITQNDCDDLIQYINGLILLKRCEMFDRINFLETNAFVNGERTIERIFKFLVNERIGELVCKDLNPQIIEYLRTLMEFQLSLVSSTIETPVRIIPDDTRSMTEVLVKLISDSAEVTGVDCMVITYGEHFLNTFKSEIFRFMLTHVSAITLVFDEKSRDNPSFLMKWIEDLLLFLKEHKHELQSHVDTTVDAILQQFTCLKNAVCNMDSRKERLINIYGTAVHLKEKPAEISQGCEIYPWILSQLTSKNGLEYKIQILKNFLICLTDHVDEQPALKAILLSLKNDGRTLCSDLSETSVNAMKVIGCFETLLILLSTTKSILTLECVIDFAAGTGDRLFDEKLETHLRGYYDGTSIEHVLQSLELTYGMFKEVDRTETERLDILHKFLLPMFKFCNADAIERFFKQNIRELYTNTNLYVAASDDDTTVKRNIMSMIGCFHLIATMYAKMGRDKLNGTNISNQIMTDEELYRKLYSNSRTVRSLQITRSGCDELTRLLHCSAYNCLLTIVSLRDEATFARYYKVIFADPDGPFVWKNVIDCSRSYKLGQTFKEYPETRETTVNIKSEIDRGERRAHRYTYVHSYDLSTSTLNEDINAYDLNRCVVLPADFHHSDSKSDSDLQQSHGTTNIALTNDDFNEHECMPYICVLLRRMIKLFGLSNEKPDWLKCFDYALLYQDNQNVKLFMLKIISNVANEVFKPYARFALESIIKAIANYLERYDLNYIITDVLEILMDWHDVIIPSSQNDKREAQRLFKILIDKILIKRSSRDNHRVYKYNLGLIRTMVQKWHSCLQVPSKSLNQKMTSAPPAAVYLILVLLDNGMTEEIVARNDIVKFLLIQLKDWDAPETDETPLQCCECLGLFLRSLDNDKLKGEIFKILGSNLLSPNMIIKQVKRIAVLCRTYPEIAVDYINVVIHAMAQHLARSYCLEIFALSMPKLNAQDIVDHLRRHIDLQTILTNRIPSCEKTALRIIRDMIATVSPIDLQSYVNLAITYVKDNITEHRELVYDILIRIHKRYSTDIAIDDDVTIQAATNTLMSISKQNLLAGLLDPSQNLQDRILRFWTEETSLSTERSKDRLIAILDMPRVTSEEVAFTSFVALMMLQLTTKSIDYTMKMFDEPLENCNFEDYRITVSWRTQNLSYVTPMFINSLASQMSYGTFSQNVDDDFRGTYSYQRFSRDIPMRLRATQDLQFEPTLPSDDDNAADATKTFNISHDFEFVQPASSSRESLRTLSYGKFSRILENTSDVANVFRRSQIRKNVQRAEMIRQENIRQRSSVQLYRKYRIGDFPDIEISHKSLIVPLQQLIKLDRLICKDMTVSLLYSLITNTTEHERKKRKEDNNFRETIVRSLKRILHDLSEKDNSFNAVILETLLQLSRDAVVIDCDPQDIVKASKANRLNALGALLLERSLLYENDDSIPTSSKKMRRCDEDIRNEETNKWTQLASLYKSLDDIDVVLSIFQGRQLFGRDMQEAALAEVNGDWLRTKDAFKNAYEQTENPSIKELCLQGLFEAVNNLCDWSMINQLVKKHVSNGDLNNIWNDVWMIPYFCDSYVYTQSKQSSKNDLTVIKSWMKDHDKLQRLKLATGENLVLFLLQGNEVKEATDLLNDLLDMTGKQWISLSPLCIELGIRELFKLQAMNNLYTLLKVIQSKKTEYLDQFVALLDFWSTKAPTIQDNIIQWNKLVFYRTIFLMSLEDYITRWRTEEDDDSCTREIEYRMRQNNCQLRLDIINAALNQKHQYIAKKHLDYLNKLKPYSSKYIPYLESSLAWLEARLEFLCADVETDISKKISNYTASWECSHRLLNERVKLDAERNIAIKEHIGMLASKIAFLSKENVAFANVLTGTTTILQNVGITESTNIDLYNVQEKLLRYSLDNLHECCELAERTAIANAGEHHCVLAKYCYNRLMSIDAEDTEIFLKFLRSTLKSMWYNYFEAAHYFPCLLKPEWLQNDETRETFVNMCATLQPWLFLRWQDLLFSHLGTPSIVIAVMPIIEKLAETYPDAIIYTYHLTIEKNPEILHDVKFQRIRSLLHNKAEEYNRFIQAIQYVVQPKLLLKHYLDEAMRDLSCEKPKAIESLLQKMESNMHTANKSPRPGEIFKEILKYEDEIKDLLLSQNCNAMRERIQKIKVSLLSGRRRNVKQPNNVKKLKDYSPFLHEYIGGNDGIEIPGQYTGDKEPAPRYHVKIARFNPQVEVMQSLRKPVCITMIGDNGREYKFLVKFGEDLTIDRGLQQLYSTINRTLHNNPGCRQRRLAIDTYEVIPLSNTFGLIQWIENTKSLDDLIGFTLSNNESADCNKIWDKYVKWIENAATVRQGIADQYKAAVSKYDQQTVTQNMKRLIGQTRRTALRDAFDVISSSPECFITLRRNFVVSYATMCAAHWLAGVGDRHLQNILVHVVTGRCLGIDFGHAFGSGIRASVPELVPFRLTPQILELLQPFTERDLLATTMIHAMRAMRDDQGPILACMDIFVHKPPYRLLNIDDDDKTMRDNEGIDADLTWSSKKNIETVAKKLNGIHPSVITLEQLKEAHNDEYFTRYQAIVSGNDGLDKQARADMRNDSLTPAEQVDCLLDQAKDLNILGRMYANWQPWL